VEEVLPSLRQQGVRVLILGEDGDSGGIEGLGDKIRQASEQPLSPLLRAKVTRKSPAVFIYTSGTTGTPTPGCSDSPLICCQNDLRSQPFILHNAGISYHLIL